MGGVTAPLRPASAIVPPGGDIEPSAISPLQTETEPPTPGDLAWTAAIV